MEVEERKARAADANKYIDNGEEGWDIWDGI